MSYLFSMTFSGNLSLGSARSQSSSGGTVQTTILIHGQVWERQDLIEEIKWCAAQNWELRMFVTADEHAHCRICWWSIGVSEDPEVGMGPCIGGTTWICKECYRHFVSPGMG